MRSSRSGCSSPTARCRQTRSCSSTSSALGTRWWLSAPPTTARCSRCATAGRVCTRWSCCRTGSTPRRSPPCSREGPDRRRALLELAAEHDFMVFEDDPYVELHFSGQKLPTMLSMDPERVVYASSFSKTVCPGIRLGYLVGPSELIAAIAKLATNTYISPNMVAQSIVYEFCASGALERSIETVRTALAKRARTLDVALRRELPEAEFVAPEGGYFMWVTLPEGTDVSALHSAAAELGVVFVKGTDFLLEGGENTLRLAYSGVTPEQIEEGVSRLAAAVRSLQSAPA